MEEDDTRYLAPPADYWRDTDERISAENARDRQAAILVNKEHTDGR